MSVVGKKSDLHSILFECPDPKVSVQKNVGSLFLEHNLLFYTIDLPMTLSSSLTPRAAGAPVCDSFVLGRKGKEIDNILLTCCLVQKRIYENLLKREDACQNKSHGRASLKKVNEPREETGDQSGLNTTWFYHKLSLFSLMWFWSC